MTDYLNEFIRLSHLKDEFENLLSSSGVDFCAIGWDAHDDSLEIFEVSVKSKLSNNLQEKIYGAGFRKAYLNYVDEVCVVYDWYSMTEAWMGPVDPKSASFKKIPR
jgi:hypothetical protein